MRLRKLQLRGFKTFADRTDIEFGPGITAVVGPNGAGKSNLTDAMLWVLGEQSHRAVRSEKWEDVIFAGSAQRAPLGMAEVALTIDNAEGKLPTDYSEVVIARRLYRSGQSEYLLNGNVVRLRDIHDLIVDSGLSPGGYAIIGQGEIDAVLSARPEDRRELIEQVAGVRKYQIRRADAERKLEKTQANLARVKDISYELQQQREPLEQQAETARQYQVLAEELKRLELSLVVLDWDRRQEKRGQALHEMDLLRQQVEQNRARLRAIEEEREVLQSRSQEMGERLDQAREKLSAAERKLDRSEQALAAARQQRTALLARQEGLLPLCEGLRRRLGELREQESALQAEAGRLRETEEQSAAGLRAKREALEAAQQRQAELEQEQSTLRSQREEFSRELALAQREFEAMESLQAELETRLERLQDQHGHLTERRAALQQQMDELREQVREAQQQAATCREQWHQAQQVQTQARQSLREHRQKKEILASYVAGLESRAAVLQELAAAQEGFAEGPRWVMQAAGRGELEGVLGLVGEMLEVPRRLEAAVEAGLDEQLQWVLVDNMEAARRAAAALVQAGVGRASFLPVDRVLSNVRASEAASIDRGPGVVGNLQKLLRFPRKLAHVFEALLQEILVVEDLEAGLVLRSRLRGPARIVTVRGELIGNLGELTAGGGDPGIQAAFSRKRELQSLQHRTEELRRYVAGMWQAEEVLEGQAGEAGENAERLDAEADQHERVAEAAEAQMRGLADSLRAAAAAVQEAEGETELLRERLTQTVERAAQAELSARGFRHRLEGTATDLERLAGEGDQTPSVASLRQEVGQGQVEQAQAQERLRSTELLSEQALRERQRAEEDLVRREAERREIEETLTSLPDQDETETTERDALRAEVERLKVEVGEHSRNLAELRQAAAELERSRREVEELGEEQREELYRAELALARSEAALENLEAQLAEIHQISLEEARKLKPAEFNEPMARREANRLRNAIRELGPVNLSAIDEVERLTARLDYLGGQVEDLERARADLMQVIAEVDQAAREAFLGAMEEIRKAFQELFEHFFPEGETSLELTDPEAPLTSGVEVIVRLPGKRRQNLLLLSGGERAMTAVALLFAMIKVRPAPFCVMDEIDAAVDASNTERLVEIIQEFARDSQFIIITHNPRTMEAASVLYGVTLRQGGGSRLISVTLEDAKRTAEEEAEGGKRPVSAGGASSRVLPVTS